MAALIPGLARSQALQPLSFPLQVLGESGLDTVNYPEVVSHSFKLEVKKICYHAVVLIYAH